MIDKECIYCKVGGTCNECKLKDCCRSYLDAKEDIRMEVYRHISGVTGTFHKKYRPTGLQEYYIMVNTFDGRQFYAPESQWEIIR